MVVASVATAFAAPPSLAAVPRATAPDRAVRGVSDTTIRVGGLGQLVRYSSADLGARARFQRANDEGGVHGRTFDYIGMRDDGGSAISNIEAAATLVDEDEVFAIAPVITPDLGAVADLLVQGVPYFGWAVSSNFCGNQWGFSFTGCMFPPGGDTTSNAWGALVAQVSGDGATPGTAAVVTESTPSGEYFLAALTAGVASAGFDVVASVNPLPVPAVADYGALAQQLVTASAGAAPDAIFVMASYANVVQLRQALGSAGYAGLVTDTVEYEPDLVASSTGALVFAPTAAVESAPTNPAMAQLVADVHAIAHGATIDPSLLAGYWSADLLVATVRRAGRTLTPDRLVRRANRRFTYQVAGTVGPVEFPAAHDEPAPCGTLVQSTGTAYVVAVPYGCGAVVDVDG
jgi:ABC-type branched-subunit amino acid transport system substrate-binding protein